MKARRLTPYEHVVFVLLARFERQWTPVIADRFPAVYEKALNRLIEGGLVEAKLPVRILLQGSRRLLNTTWRVKGEYAQALEEGIGDYVRVLGVYRPDYASQPRAPTAARLSPNGEVAKILLEEIWVPNKEPSEDDWAVMWTISGGPDGDQAECASGEAIFLEGNDPFDIAASRHPEPEASGAPSTLSTEAASPTPRASPASTESPAPAFDPSSDIVRKLDEILLASRRRLPVGGFGHWKGRDAIHNNRILTDLLDAVPDMTSREAAQALGASSHTLIVRTDVWKQRRGGRGADAISYAENHQNMQYDADTKAEDPAKLVATWEEQAAQVRRAIVAAGLEAKVGDIEDDAQFLEAVAKLSRKDPMASERLQRAWLVQCTAPHQAGDA